MRTKGWSFLGLGDLYYDLGFQRQLYVGEGSRNGMGRDVPFFPLPGVYLFLPNLSILSICLSSLRTPPLMSAHDCNLCLHQWETAY